MTRVLINPEVVKAIKHEMNLFPRRECAGALIGEIEAGGSVIKVLKATSSGPRAAHYLGAVSPDVTFLNREIERAERDGLQFIGEWHNHPDNFASPSPSDVQTILTIMSDNELKQYLALIVTDHNREVHINAHLFTEDGICTRVSWEVSSTNVKI